MLPHLPRLIAHRGASQFAPENTLVALRQASAMGATWVEFDVCLTLDKVPVVIHDITLDRTTDGVGLVSERTYAELQQWDAGSWFAADFAGTKIPSLDQWLSSAADLGMGINLEIKGDVAAMDELVNQVLISLERHWSSRLPPPIISSASLICLQSLRRQAPYSDLNLGLISDEWLPDWQKILAELACWSWHLNHKLLHAERVEAIMAKGYRVLAYTVNSAKVAQKLFDLGVTAVFSDNPLLLE